MALDLSLLWHEPEILWKNLIGSFDLESLHLTRELKIEVKSEKDSRYNSKSDLESELVMVYWLW